MFITAVVFVVLGLLGIYFARKEHVQQRADTARLLSIICGVLAVLFMVGGVLGWGRA